MLRSASRLLLIAMLGLVLVACDRTQPTVPTVPPNPDGLVGAGRPRETVGRRDPTELPVYFVANQGQLDPRVAFYVPGQKTNLYFTAEGVRITQHTSRLDDTRLGGEARMVPGRWTVAIDFVDIGPDARLEARDASDAIVSYFKGTPDQWRTSVPTYHELVYRDLWPGIDLVYGGTAGRLKYTFVVHPGADPSQIQLAYRGASSVVLATTGEIDVNTPLGGFRDAAPYSYQDLPDGRRIEVPSAYRLGADAADESPDDRAAMVGFVVGEYDPTTVLVLDPVVIIYAGFIGGDDFDGADGVAVDAQGAVYVVGQTRSSHATFPNAVGPDTTYNDNGDAFIAKVRADGTGLVYAGYIGGNGGDSAAAVAVDSQGNAYVVGASASSTGFPTVWAGPTLGTGLNSDAFIAVVNPSGQNLVYATRIGGSDYDTANGVAVDGTGAAYVAGYTQSTEKSFPVLVGPDLTHNGGPTNFAADAFVLKVKADATGLVYAGFIGGNGGDFGNGIALEPGCASNCAAYVTGGTRSAEATFPVLVGPDLTYNGGTNGDAFVAKVKPDGTGLLYAGYIGGNTDDVGDAIAVDGQGNAYVVGTITGANASFPVLVGPQVNPPGGFDDGFVTKVNPSGSALVYSGFIGGSRLDRAEGVKVDAGGNAYIAGSTSSSVQDGFPAVDGPSLIHRGGFDAFVAKLRPDGSGFLYAGYVGGSPVQQPGGGTLLGDDLARDIAIDAAGNAYIVGVTNSTEASFPVAVGPDLTHNGGEHDGFVVKVAFTPNTPTVGPTSTATRTATPVPPTATRTATPAPPTSTPTPVIVPVAIIDFAFAPAPLTVNVGDTVRWTNNGGTLHTTTGNAGAWNSGVLSPGQTFSFTFGSSGTFTYFCSIHPSMQGAITAGAASTPTPTQSTVSGHGFELEADSSPILRWRPGTQTKSLVIRWDAITNVFAFPGIDLAPNTGGFVDHATLTSATYCYVLLAYLGELGAPDVRGIGDLFCLYPGTGAGTNRPSQFRAVLNEGPNLELRWFPPGGQTRYELRSVRFDGSGPRTIEVAGGQTFFTENIGTLTTCYQLVAFNGPTELGRTDQICGAPGVASFTAGGPDVGAALNRIQKLAPSAPPAPGRAE